jgi:hypothetical protein
MKLSDTEKEALRDEFIEYKNCVLIDGGVFTKEDEQNYWIEKIEAILEKKEKDIVEMIESLKALNLNEGIIVEDFITKTGLRLRNDTIDEIINKLNNKDEI